MWKIALVGSRKYPNLKLIDQFFRNFIFGYNNRFHAITGDASGVDAAVINAAISWKCPYTVHPAAWYGEDGTQELQKAAGISRNADIVQDAQEMTVYWDNESKGTANDIVTWTMIKPHHLLTIYGPTGEKLDVETCIERAGAITRWRKPLTS